MRNNLIPVVWSVLISGSALATSAQAHAICDGDFEHTRDGWIATSRCQRHEAARVAQEQHRHLTGRISSAWDVTPDEFCRGNNDIRVSTFCAAYKD